MTQKVHVTWEDVDGEEITNGTDGYIVNQGTVDFDNVQRSTLTITAARLKSVVEHEGRYTTWKCKVRSTQFPLSDMFEKDLIVEFPKYGETDRLSIDCAFNSYVCVFVRVSDVVFVCVWVCLFVYVSLLVFESVLEYVCVHYLLRLFTFRTNTFLV